MKLSDDLMRLLAATVAVSAALSSMLIESSPLTFALSILFMFFLPGYALTRLVFHERVKLDVFILLSIGMSVIISMLLSAGLALAGILTQDISIMSLLGITLIALMLDKIAHHANRKFEVEFVMPKKEQIDPVMAVGIAFGLILIGIFSYMILTAVPQSNSYIALLSEDMDIDLPKNGTVGQPVNFTLELRNGEGRRADFRIDIRVNGSVQERFNIALDINETEDIPLDAIPSDPGYQQIMVEVYIDDAYYNEVHFWIIVS